VRAYSTSVSEAVTRAPIAYLVGRDILETQLSPGDAGRIERAIEASLAAGILTRDIGGQASTREMTEAIIARL